MSLSRFALLSGAAGAVLVATAAWAQTAPTSPVRAAGPSVPATRLFADSRVIVGDRISVEVVGQGPDVILIPGLASSRETWRATAGRLRGLYRLHLVQVAGFAGEPARGNASGEVVIPTARAIDAYLVDQKLVPAVVIGHSLGGTIALWLAENHPEHLKKVLLVDALPFFATVMMGPAASLEQVRPLAERIRTSPPQPEAASAKMIGGMVSSEADRAEVMGWSRASDSSVVSRALADDLELDLRPGLATIPTPITVFYPDNAAVGMPTGAADAFYGAAFAPVPHKTLKRVDHALHFIMFDQPAAFAADLDAFLAG